MDKKHAAMKSPAANPYGNRTLPDGALELRLPYPPSVNDYKIPVKNRPGLYYLTPRAQRFRADVTWICSGALTFGEELVEVEIAVHPPDERRRDVDNTLKALLDSLEAGCIIKNDAQILRLLVTKEPPVADGLVIIVVRPWRGR